MASQFIVHPFCIGGHYHQQELPQDFTACSEKRDLTLNYSIGSESYVETYQLQEVRLERLYRFYVSQVHSDECQKQLLIQAIQQSYPEQIQTIPTWLTPTT